MAHESISALLDGECTPDEMDVLLDAMERDPELKQAWSRQCLAREAREGTAYSRNQACICAGVMAALDEQPSANPRVVELASRRRPLAAFGWKPLAGLATAASVAALAVLLAIPSREAALDGAPAFESSNELSPATTLPTALPRRTSRNLQSVALRPEEQAQREELAQLLMEHSGSMADQGMNGTLRYARFAAHTAGYRPQAGDGR